MNNQVDVVEVLLGAGADREIKFIFFFFFFFFLASLTKKKNRIERPFELSYNEDVKFFFVLVKISKNKENKRKKKEKKRKGRENKVKTLLQKGKMKPTTKNHKKTQAQQPQQATKNIILGEYKHQKTQNTHKQKKIHTKIITGPIF